MELKLGKKIYKNAAILAPMAGYSDRAMRVICHGYGAAFSVTEMVSAKAVVYGDEKTYSLAAMHEDEGDVALQIFGSEPDIMARAAERLERELVLRGSALPVAMDINMGCPVHKIFSNGDGSALMRDPELIYRIVRAVSGSVSMPVSVKIRAGIDETRINAVECALAAESGGAKLITVHGRTRAQMYSGLSDRGIIREVKRAAGVPVIANGDVASASDAISMINETGADGIMIGRGAVGNPFLFAEVNAALRGEEIPEFGFDERRAAAVRQLDIAILEKGEECAVREARKQIALYFRGYRGSAALRARINSALTRDEVLFAIDGVRED